MICILHGYLLDGSGSNLWTSAMTRALCRIGHPVHLVCQEAHPDAFDFITAAHVYEPDGSVTTLFERETPYPGDCVMHKPQLGDTLPVYVADRYEEFSNVVPMVDLPDNAIAAYLSPNIATVEGVVRDYGITSLHANHAVLMSVVAERVSATTGVPFAIMPHGSAIEYVVKKDRRFHVMAAGAFDRAARIFVQGPEMHRRVIETFPDLVGLENKLMSLNLGVDAQAFKPIQRKDRTENVSKLINALKGRQRGMPRDALQQLGRRLHTDIAHQELSAILAEAQIDRSKLPDVGVEEKLASVDWGHDDVLLFVGRLMAAKGLQGIIAALPQIFASRPGARLIVVGDGPIRPVMQAFLWALEHGEKQLAMHIVDRGSELEGGGAVPYDEMSGYFAGLKSRGELDTYFEGARQVIRPDRVIFTGFLSHAELKYLMPCCDVAIFPSKVAEAGPLVLLEAAASGCFPLGTYFAGMAAHIDSIARSLPPADAALMRLSKDASRTVANIITNTEAALALEGVHKTALRRCVEEHYDWVQAAHKFAVELAALNST